MRSLTVLRSSHAVRYTTGRRDLGCNSSVLERGGLHPGTQRKILAVYAAGVCDGAESYYVYSLFILLPNRS